MALNETGIHNVVSLFLTLSMTVDMGEMVRFYKAFTVRSWHTKTLTNGVEQNFEEKSFCYA